MKLFSNGFNTKSLYKKNLQFGKWRWEGMDNCWERIYSILLPGFFFFSSSLLGNPCPLVKGGQDRSPPNHLCPSTFHLGRDMWS